MQPERRSFRKSRKNHASERNFNRFLAPSPRRRPAGRPSLVSAVEMETKSTARVQGGKNRFSFETEFPREQLHHVLDENWNRLPEPIAKAARVDIEVHWSAKAGVQRVVTDSDAEL